MTWHIQPDEKSRRHFVHSQKNTKAQVKKRQNYRVGGKCSLCIMIVLFHKDLRLPFFWKKNYVEHVNLLLFLSQIMEYFLVLFSNNYYRVPKKVPGPALLTNGIMFSIIARLLRQSIKMEIAYCTSSCSLGDFNAKRTIVL